MTPAGDGFSESSTIQAAIVQRLARPDLAGGTFPGGCLTAPATWCWSSPTWWRRCAG
jgi:hypothetical protein